MSKHLFGAVVTHYGLAANNRGENEGNLITLQKVLWNDETRSTVSAEAIRWAIRYYWQMRAESGEEALQTNRIWDDATSDNRWRDTGWSGWSSAGRTYIDDDVLGFMVAEAAKVEGNESEAPPEKPGTKKRPAKGKATKRRGVLELTRAISMTPFVGDATFNAKSGEKGSTSLYATEVHATRFQYGFAMTPQRLHDQARLAPTLDAILSLGEVAGNHSRFLYDFSPESIVLRWTDDAAPRLLYAFEETNGQVNLNQLLHRVAAGDIPASELVVGGGVVRNGGESHFAQHGVAAFEGVKAAVGAMKERMGRAS